LRTRAFAYNALLHGHATLDRLADYGVFAPVGAVERRYSYSEARGLVLDSYGSFSPRAPEIVARFFAEGWIAAPPRPTKFFGAFCESEAPALHPFVLLNHRGRFGDVMAMAHELGHGLHGLLAAPGGIFHVQAPAMLAAGRSDSPHQLMAMVGIDLRDPSFWNSGLELIDMPLREAETLAATSAR